ncbi:TOBE domain-containing protein [Halorussus gelatinilyticus]|uniref:TOBE domain-containing protein n=1 Tax=Halorussus gelatinilyticus TaxID=2937524 RepID=A0A8U0IHA3_9EURY|nr:TOBE domain-containing protein [Halorussus gelatinilyticus]UPV99683.1 TOBE domain-containing protein [Halorussus gelatinilyticus]
MALSARNRLAGTVKSLDTEGLMAEVVVETDEGTEVTSIITGNSADRLGLEEGAAVNAVVKATDVMIENE